MIFLDSFRSPASIHRFLMILQNTQPTNTSQNLCVTTRAKDRGSESP
jgi:hypothetical protein